MVASPVFRACASRFFLRALQEKDLSHQHEDSLASESEDRGGRDRHGEKRFAGMSADPDMWLSSEHKGSGA